MLFPVTHASLPQSLHLCVSYKHYSYQWQHPTNSAYFPGFPDYGFYSGPGDQRGAPCSFADYATLGPHTGQMLQSEHVTSTCNSPSQHHPSPDHFKSSGVYGIFCLRHVLCSFSIFMSHSKCRRVAQHLGTLHAESCSPSFLCQGEKPFFVYPLIYYMFNSLQRNQFYLYIDCHKIWLKHFVLIYAIHLILIH